MLFGPLFALGLRYPAYGPPFLKEVTFYKLQYLSPANKVNSSIMIFIRKSSKMSTQLTRLKGA